MQREVILLVMAAATPAAANTWTAGAEVGTTVRGEGDTATGGLRLGAHTGGTFTTDDGDVTLTAGGDATLGDDAPDGMRASQWVQARFDMVDTEKAPYVHGWVTGKLHLDWNLRVPFAQRRDLPAAQISGWGLQQGGVFLTETPRFRDQMGWAFLAAHVDVRVLSDRPADQAHTSATARIAIYQRFDDRDGDGISHVREYGVFEINSLLGEIDGEIRGETFALYGERDRPLPGGLRADFRLGVAGGERGRDDTEEERDLARPLLDGALRRPLGDTTLEMRYDRAAFVTFDELLAIEDRATARAAWAAGRWSLGADAYVARTATYDADLAFLRADRSDGVHLRAGHALRGWKLDGALDAGHTYYARTDEMVGTPTTGWRATLDLSRTFGSPR